MKNIIIVGAGLAGSVAARILAEAGFSVNILEKREHIGGNVFDYKDENGIIIHKYGPHIFHTNDLNVFEFLSRFSEFVPYKHEVLGYIEEKLLPIPFNLSSMKMVYREQEYEFLRNLLISRYGYGARIPIIELRKEKQISDLAQYIYDKVFFNYTNKQWGMSPELLDSDVTSRVPVVLSDDSRYFSDTIQVMPVDGYTTLVTNIINHKNIQLTLNCDATKQLKLNEDIIYYKEAKFQGDLIYTGCIDELLDFKYGVLPYRSLIFEFKTINADSFQPTAVINYPNDNQYTRITEFKKFYSDNDTKKTVIAYEYPCQYNENNIPYYPIPQQRNKILYNKYKNDLIPFKNLHLIGRLGEYRYYNMDMVVKRGMEIAKMIINKGE